MITIASDSSITFYEHTCSMQRDYNECRLQMLSLYHDTVRGRYCKLASGKRFIIVEKNYAVVPRKGGDNQ